MAAVGVAAMAALEVVCGGEDEVWAFVVEVLRGELLAGWRIFFLLGLGIASRSWWGLGHSG